MHNNFKNALITLLLTTIFSFWSSTAHPMPANTDSLRYEILMSSKMLDDIQFNDKFIPSLAVTSNRLILLSTSDQFYLLGWGGIVPLGKKVTGTICAYAFTPDSLLMTIRNNELCTFDSLGNLNTLYKLPGEGMGISAGKQGMFVYDRNEDQEKNMLYVIAKGGLFAPLFGIPAPIRAVTDMTNSILFASDNAVYSYKFEDKEVKSIISLPKDSIIKSIAVDITNKRIYFSTDNMVFAMKDSSAVLITDKFGGELKYFNDGLLVFNPEKKYLIRIIGLEQVIVP
jgi:hypothetical protein